MFGSAAKKLVTFGSIAKENVDVFKVDSTTPPEPSESKSEDKAQVLEKIEIPTGEEDERHVFQSRAKLFIFDTDKKDWIEKGIGTVKINSDQKESLRTIMRSEGTLKILLNFRHEGVKVFRSENSKTARIVIPRTDGIDQYLIQLRSLSDADSFCRHFLISDETKNIESK